MTSATTYNEACRIEREYRKDVRAAWLDGLWLILLAAGMFVLGFFVAVRFSTAAPVELIGLEDRTVNG